MLENLNIRTQILGSFIILASIILFVISSIALVNINLVGGNTQKLATKAMEDQINRNMLLSSNETAQIIARKVYTAEAVVQSLANAAEQLFSSDLDVYGYKSSYLDLNVSNMPLAENLENYSGIISTYASSYYVPFTTLNNLSIITPEMNNTISKSSHLDVVFKSFFDDYPEFAWFKVAFEDGDILRQYPASLISADRSYNPTQDLWYTEASDASRGTIIITDPYIDLVVDEWVISVAKKIYDDDGEIGVVAADYKLDDLREVVNDIEFLKSGFAALILQGILKGGQTIAHPRWSETTNELLLISDLEEINNSVLQIISSNEEGMLKYIKQDQNYLISHSPVTNNYVLLIFVKEAEAVEAISDIEKNIANAQLQVTYTTIIVVVGIFSAVLAIGLLLADRISKPIADLSESALNIVSHVTERDFIQKIEFDSSSAQNDEIGQLSKSFSNMIESMKDQQSNFCRKCGIEFLEADKFCRNCGEARPEKTVERKSFFCQLDNEKHPATDSAYQCDKCSRMVCEDCFNDAKSAGMVQCPYCKGHLSKAQ
ncbi:MAG: cache domain-containing protein [Candidatus Hodarchaeales archaeon]|jgi:HAMP domain-containing protein